MTLNTISNFELNDVQFKEYLTKEWLNHKDYWSTGATPEQLLVYTQPTEGDLECLIDNMIDGLHNNHKEYLQLFHFRLNQALRLFGYSK